MPKVYEQQVSWQPANGARMQYDKLQDFVGVALNNVTKASEGATEAIQQVADKQAASELERVAQEAAYDIENWTDFNNPKKTQIDMVASAMNRYDKAMAGMDYSTRNRINLYNPRARDIFEVKTKEKAADVCYKYAFKESMSDIDNQVGRMINESRPDENPQNVIGAMKAHLDTMKKTMRPADYLVYEKSFKAATEEGMVEWYIAHGRLDKAHDSAVSDAITGDVDEVTRARWLKAIDGMLRSGGDGSSASSTKFNLLDVLTSDNYGYDTGDALSIMGRMSDSIMTGSALPADLQQYTDVVLAGGKTYNELRQMPRSQANEILNKNLDTIKNARDQQAFVRAEFLPLMYEWEDNKITEEDGNKRKLKKGADITRLKDLAKNFQEKGYGTYLKALPDNNDMSNTYDAIMDAIAAENKAQVLAISGTGTNMSFAFNNPHMSNFFATPTPATKEQAKLFNTPEYTQQMSLVNEGMRAVGALDYLNSLAFDDMGNRRPESGMSIAPAEAYFDEDELYKLDSLEAQQQYLNEIVLSDEAEELSEQIDTWTQEGKAGWGPVEAADYKREHIDVPANKITRAKNMQRQLDKMLEGRKISQERYNELSRYLYDLSEGKASKTFPCLIPNSKMPANVWNQCLTSYGFGTVKNTAAYDAEMDRGWHDMAAPLRRATKTKFKSGEVGDVLQLLVAYIDDGVQIPGNSEYFGIPEGYASVLTPQVMAEVYNAVESKYTSLGQIHNLVDLTNNSDVYARKGGEADGKTWNPVSPSPETTTDITQSKQYEIINAIEKELSNQLKYDVRISDEMKNQMAMNVRRISKGSKGSVRGISNKELEERTSEKAAKTIKGLIGE